MTTTKIRTTIIALTATLSVAVAPAASQAAVKTSTTQTTQGQTANAQRALPGTTNTHPVGPVVGTNARIHIDMGSTGNKGSASAETCEAWGNLANDSGDKALDAAANGDQKGFDKWDADRDAIIDHAMDRGCFVIY